MASSTVVQNLFSPRSGSSKSKSSFLIEVKAGKMIRENTMVKPDLRKGLVYMTQSDDSLLHFCWKDRTNGNVEDDLIIFPDEAEWIRVTQCTTGRVYVLKFKTSTQRLFFWLQDASDKDDEQLSSKINKLLKDPSSAQTLNINNGSSEQRQLMELLEQQGFLDALRGGENDTVQPARTSGEPSLASHITPELIEPVLQDQQLLSQLFPHLPDNHANTADDVRSLIRSPQFQQALESLGQAIESGQHAPLLAELGIDPAVAHENGSKTLALLRAIKKRADQRKNRMDTE